MATIAEFENLCRALGVTNMVTLDYESRFGKFQATDGKIYKLGFKSSSQDKEGQYTEAYIRHPWFKEFMCGVKLNGGTCRLYHPYNSTLEVLYNGTVDWSTTAVLAHNTRFDGGIMSLLHGIRPRLLLDTFSMARAIHGANIGGSLGYLSERYNLGVKGRETENFKDVWELDPNSYLFNAVAEYCAGTELFGMPVNRENSWYEGDVNLCYKLFFNLLPNIPIEQLLVSDTILRMFTEPVALLNHDLLMQEHGRLLKEREEILLSLGLGSDAEQVKKLFTSANKFAAVLKANGYEIPWKLTEKNPSSKKYTHDVQAYAVANNLPINEAWEELESFRELGEHTYNTILQRQDIQEALVWIGDEKNATYAFDKKSKQIQDWADGDDPKIAALIEAKMNVNSNGAMTRCLTLADTATRGPAPVPLKYCGAHTTRQSGDDGVNWQNFPKKGSLIRDAIVAPDDYVFGKNDSKQMQARLTEWAAGQLDGVGLYRKFDKGEINDIYQTFGIEHVFGYHFEVKQPNGKDDTIERFTSKQALLLSGFEGGWRKLQSTVAGFNVKMPNPQTGEYEQYLMDDETAKKATYGYRNAKPFVTNMWRTMETALRHYINGQETVFGYNNVFRTSIEKQGIVLPNGMVIKYRDAYIDDEGNIRFQKDVKKQKTRDTYEYTYGGKLYENVIQGLEQVLIQHWMVQIQWLLGIKVVWSDHDALITLHREDKAEEEMQKIKVILSTPMDWCPDLPLNSSGGYGKIYGQIKD